MSNQIRVLEAMTVAKVVVGTVQEAVVAYVPVRLVQR